MKNGLLFFVIALATAGQNRSDFRVEIPPSVASDRVFLEYCLYSTGVGCSWVSPRPSRSGYTISATFQGRRVRYLKAILYAPGCAVDAFTIEAEERVHRFICRPLASVVLSGQLAVKSPLYGKQVNLRATYAATWAKRFFGTDDAMADIPIGEPVEITENGKFRFDVPDFSSDRVTAGGSLYIWAKEKLNGNLVALLVPEGTEKKINSLKVQREYPMGLLFYPCPASASPVHGKSGFAIRGASDQPCSP